MSTSGNIKREFVRPLFESRGFTGEGQTYPYARGKLTYASGWSQHGGGIYLHEGSSFKRIWCTTEANPQQCELAGLSISPGGCHAAFFAKGSDDPKARYKYMPTLKVLPLCP